MSTPARTTPLQGLPLLEDLPPLEGRRVLVRTDFNTPLRTDANGQHHVCDDFRIRSGLATLEWLLDQGAQVRVCTHLGDPDGVVDPELRIAPVRERLDELCPGVELMENVRFSPGEKACDDDFVRQLVDGADSYVNEAFGVSHRGHASVVGPPRLVPSAAGRRLAEEVEVLSALLTVPRRPFVGVVGGAKIADKLGVLQALAEKVDTLVVGGGMAFTFLVAMGHHVGASLVDLDRVEDCRRLLESDVQILLPTDIVALEPGGSFGTGAAEPRGGSKVVGLELADGWMGLDIGPESAEQFADVIEHAGTVLWNGPVGAFEDDRFSSGTRAVAAAVARSHGFTVVGGGDSACALDGLGLARDVDFVSTGGGASLNLIEHGDLPGLEALRRASNAPGRATEHP